MARSRAIRSPRRCCPALRAKRINPHNLGYLLSIVQGSSVPDAVIAKIAARKAAAKYDRDFTPTWYATWAGVDPTLQSPPSRRALAALNDPAEQTNLALRFVVALLGGRQQEGRARLAYRTVEHMKTLYLLMAKYIREEDDIERSGGGVYSPGLRDDAQDARNALFSSIRETPGKEAYLALMEMERAHPAVSSRPWMGFHAKTKATLDADLAPWNPGQVKEFNDARVATADQSSRALVFRRGAARSAKARSRAWRRKHRLPSADDRPGDRISQVHRRLAARPRRGALQHPARRGIGRCQAARSAVPRRRV